MICSGIVRIISAYSSCAHHHHGRRLCKQNGDTSMQPPRRGEAESQAKKKAIENKYKKHPFSHLKAEK
jgi:hypothetical protein